MFRPEASLIYVNGDAVLEAILNRIRQTASPVLCLAVRDLSAAPHVDLAGVRMLHELHAELINRGITLRIIGAHGSARDLLRADGIEDKVGGLDRTLTLDGALRAKAV